MENWKYSLYLVTCTNYRNVMQERKMDTCKYFIYYYELLLVPIEFYCDK